MNFFLYVMSGYDLFVSNVQIAVHVWFRFRVTVSCVKFGYSRRSFVSFIWKMSNEEIDTFKHT